MDESCSLFFFAPLFLLAVMPFSEGPVALSVAPPLASPDEPPVGPPVAPSRAPVAPPRLMPPLGPVDAMEVVAAALAFFVLVPGLETTLDVPVADNVSTLSTNMCIFPSDPTCEISCITVSVISVAADAVDADPVADAGAADPVAEPVADPVAVPVADPVAVPVADPVADPVAKSDVGPSAETAADLAAGPNADPVATLFESASPYMPSFADNQSEAAAPPHFAAPKASLIECGW